MRALLDAHRGWLLAAVMLAPLPYVGAAIALQGAVPERLPFAVLTRVHIAGAFATVVAPAGLANLALNALMVVWGSVHRIASLSPIRGLAGGSCRY